MATKFEFKKATKFDAKGRVALIGPAGSGKTMTALRLARQLAGPDGKIAAIDTEHGSMSKYAATDGIPADNLTTFDFDVIELDTFTPDNFIGALDAAEQAGYAVFLPDSLSHFWMGQGGALEFVDMAAKRSNSRDGMAGWKDFTPIERRMVDRMIASKCHVICTMRTKTEYQDQDYTNSRGERKKQRVKVGLAPVQRQGLEYEFDLIGYMNEENEFVTDKTRCPAYAKQVIPQPKMKDFEPFSNWLKGVVREAVPVPAAPVPAPAENAPAPAAAQPNLAATPRQPSPADPYMAIIAKEKGAGIRKVFNEIYGNLVGALGDDVGAADQKYVDALNAAGAINADGEADLMQFKTTGPARQAILQLLSDIEEAKKMVAA